jgi:hypothetical protein
MNPLPACRVTSDSKKGRMIRTDAGMRGVRTFEQ